MDNGWTHNSDSLSPKALALFPSLDGCSGSHLALLKLIPMLETPHGEAQEETVSYWMVWVSSVCRCCIHSGSVSNHISKYMRLNKIYLIIIFYSKRAMWMLRKCSLAWKTVFKQAPKGWLSHTQQILKWLIIHELLKSNLTLLKRSLLIFW